MSLAPNVTEILFAIGAGRRVVGRTEFCNFPPEATKRPSVGGYVNFSAEAILALSPDLVVASRGNPKTALAGLKRHGLTLLAISPETLADLRQSIRLLGRAAGNETQAERVVRDMDRIFEDVKKAVAQSRRPRVYFGTLTGPYYAAGPRSLIGECIALAGGDNIAAAAREPWPTLSIETILASNPEVIIEGFHGSPGGEARRALVLARLRKDSVWSQVAAVKTGRVHALNDDVVHRAGPRTADAVAAMARLFHPEVKIGER